MIQEQLLTELQGLKSRCISRQFGAALPSSTGCSIRVSGSLVDLVVRTTKGDVLADLPEEEEVLCRLVSRVRGRATGGRMGIAHVQVRACWCTGRADAAYQPVVHMAAHGEGWQMLFHQGTPCEPFEPVQLALPLSGRPPASEEGRGMAQEDRPTKLHSGQPAGRAGFGNTFCSSARPKASSPWRFSPSRIASCSRLSRTYRDGTHVIVDPTRRRIEIARSGELWDLWKLEASAAADGDGVAPRREASSPRGGTGWFGGLSSARRGSRRPKRQRRPSPATVPNCSGSFWA